MRQPASSQKRRLSLRVAGNREHRPLRCAQVILSAAAAAVAFSSIVLGKALNLAYSAKLYAIAFLIVTFGAVDEETTDTSVFLLASMRVLGIASGVLLSEVAAVLIFPRSATQASRLPLEQSGYSRQCCAASWVILTITAKLMLQG